MSVDAFRRRRERGDQVVCRRAGAELANVLWKEVRRGELGVEEAELIAAAVDASDIAFHTTRGSVGRATAIAGALDHPAHGA